METLKNILTGVGEAAKHAANQQYYEAGYEDGRSGSPRRFTSPFSERDAERLTFYNQGYDDGLRQQMMDKLD